MIRTKTFSLTVALAAWPLMAAIPHGALADTTNYVAFLQPINNNGNHGVNSTANGVAHLQLTTSPTVDTLTVTIDASGLEPNQPHAQHIHGFGPGGMPAQTPTLATADPDHDGLINLPDGQVTYGPIQQNLITSPTVSPGSVSPPLSAFPMATAGGTEHYSETFTYNLSNPTDAAVIAAILPLNHQEIVLHGLTVPPGTDTGNPQGPPSVFDAVFPVASGVITAVPEPTSLALLSTGLLGMGWWARRRQGAARA